MGASSSPTLPGDAQALRPFNTQSVAYTGTAAAISNPVGSSVVRIMCTTAAFIAIGTDPTANSGDMPVPANSPEYFRIQPGEKVSALRESVSGTLYVTEMD